MNQTADTTASELAELRKDMAYLVARQRRNDELFEELTPIAKLFMDDFGERLEGLDKRGYVAFGQELMKVLDRIVTGFTVEDVRSLGDNVVTILDTVKSVTQPDVMQIIHEATNAIHEGDVQEHGLFGMLRSTRDKDVRRGLGVVLGVLKHVGRAADQAATATTGDVIERVAARRPGLARSLAPRLRHGRRQQDRAALPSPPPIPASTTTPTSVTGPQGDVAGFTLDSCGFLASPDQWTTEFAGAMASQLNIAMTDAHWAVVKHARDVFGETCKAANVRALAKGSGLSTRELYTLFPKAPGKTIARIAGTPKPAGCL